MLEFGYNDQLIGFPAEPAHRKSIPPEIDPTGNRSHRKSIPPEIDPTGNLIYASGTTYGLTPFSRLIPSIY
jgi:hypothetical protein